MSKNRLFSLLLLLPACLWAIPYEVSTVKEGSGEPIQNGQLIRVHYKSFLADSAMTMFDNSYTGWLASGRKFSSSKDYGKPLTTVLGGGRLIAGWEIGLDGIAPGAVRWLKISPSMGYGAKSYSAIPPNSTLIFRVEMENVDRDDALAETMDFFPNLEKLDLQDGPEGLRYAIIHEGEGEGAKPGQNVRVHYTGFLSDGKKFDSSRDRGQIFNFPLGKGNVIRGWDLGVEGMLPGEKRVLVIPPELGYGNRGGGPIPGNATLVFVVEYLGAQE